LATPNFQPAPDRFRLSSRLIGLQGCAKTCTQADVVKPRSQRQNHRYLGVKPGFGRRSGIYLISGCLDDFQMGFGSMAGAFGKVILARRSPSMSFRLATIR
jgi:hypothetical protein